MTKFVFRSPGKYIQGRNILDDRGKKVQVLGSHPLILTDKILWNLTQETIKKVSKKASLSYSYIEFNGEASPDEIVRLARKVNVFLQTLLSDLAEAKHSIQQKQLQMNYPFLWQLFLRFPQQTPQQVPSLLSIQKKGHSKDINSMTKILISSL